ncbi:MAG: 3-deoxy-D-manno-octulosonic acid transferase [Bacteroidales bacterium]|nr:3-deoxy-D-manno-octulosonic acid transferase [Bacteroidales bacterium]MCF8388636.1 3-deoxy-D-manno-octulosonic acid transferase [Bacteroidales bacterium]MCF8398249.1 3-deoxy-D-manno-octulosonic acid transferase [Bacteroidales bacterium]
MFFIYKLAIRFYLFSIRIASFFNPKAKRWIEGRKNWEKGLKQKINRNDRYIWVHCASLGEFEQGRPLIEKLKSEYPSRKILLSFFSPSGYEIRKNYEHADAVVYLPMDTGRNARKFLEILNPELAVFVKYEFWFNYIAELKRRNIPVFVVSAIFREKQHFFRSWGKWFRKQLHKINWIFVQNEDSLKLLEGVGITHCSLSGDTRFDRVAQIAETSKAFPEVENFVGGQKVLLAGSTWPPGEKLIQTFLHERYNDLKLIIAPHEVHQERINGIENSFPGKCIRYSNIHQSTGSENILIIDSIGKLSHLYQYASLAYIGGGFGVGIHNILEAATFGKPVIFGPNYQKFKEARDLISLGGAFSVSNADAFKSIMRKLLAEQGEYEKASRVCKQYTRENQGATNIIFQKMEDLLSLHE